MQDDCCGVWVCQRQCGGPVRVAAGHGDAVASRRLAQQRDHARRSHADGATPPTDPRLRAEQPCQRRTDGRETAKRLRRTFPDAFLCGARPWRWDRGGPHPSPNFGAPSSAPSLVGPVRRRDSLPRTRWPWSAPSCNRCRHSCRTWVFTPCEAWRSGFGSGLVGPGRRVGGGDGRAPGPAGDRCCARYRLPRRS